MNGIRVPGNPVSTCSGRTGRARRCLDHPWPSPAIAPALQAYRPSMASATAPALSAYRPSMRGVFEAPRIKQYPFVVSPQNPFVVSLSNHERIRVPGIPTIHGWNPHGMGAMRSMAIAGNCSCIAGIPTIHGWNPHGMGAMRSMAIAGNCSCIAGIPTIHGIADNCSCVVGIPSIHGHKKTRRAFLPRRVLPPHESISQLHNPNDFLTYATPQRSMKSRCGLRRKSS
jgi:hypothetical protein